PGCAARSRYRRTARTSRSRRRAPVRSRPTRSRSCRAPPAPSSRQPGAPPVPTPTSLGYLVERHHHGPLFSRALERGEGRGDSLVLGAGEATVRAHLGELVGGVGLCEVFLQDVASDEVVVIGERVPPVEVAGEKVDDPHALAAERLGPRRPVRGAEDGLAARAPDLAVDLRGEPCSEPRLARP